MRLRLASGLLEVVLIASLTCAATPIRILFMHHSTGANLIREGEVREGLSALGYESWDHGYERTDSRTRVASQPEWTTRC